MTSEIGTEFPWYQVVGPDHGIQQGDILEDVVVILPVRSDENPDETRYIDEKVFNLIVMTQSCDIEDGAPYIAMCPLWTQEEIGDQFLRKDTIDLLRKGRIIGFYPITKATLPPLERPFRIVQFQRVIELERGDIERQIPKMGPRLRLLPPYREDLSQAFARFFMRVGLPIPFET